MLAELLIIVIMPHNNISETGAMVGLMIAGFIGGIGRAYFENTSYALFGTCPSKHMSGVMVGVSVSGALVSALQIVLLVSMSGDYSSILLQSIIYFSVSIAIIFICSLLLLSLLCNSFAKQYIA
uniref:Equilibrative nucleoside transporter 4 n=1 Tax=Lygus hesperus TaxID=30085 RepID=A0A0A9XZF4_LYGHE